ncbi:MAG: amino acid racemase [Thermoplasmatales archaeon]
MTKKRLLGIIGGMGPEATSLFFNKIINHTDARIDQEHVPAIIYNYPQIPDRVLWYHGQGESPVPYIVGGMKKLESIGVDLFAMPCNTAHIWFDEIKENINTDILNMIGLTVKTFSKFDSVGLLATNATVESRLYEKPLTDNGIEVLLPSDQKKVMEQIKLIKSGKIFEAKKELLTIAGELINGGSEYLLAGCTEIPLAIDNEDIPVPLVDPMEIMAKEAINQLGGKIKEEI